VDAEETVFRIEVTAEPDGVQVIPRGELDVATQAELRAALDRHAGAAAVTLDLSRLRFLDTSGLRLILETAESARRDGRAFSVVPGSPTVQRLFDVAGVTELVPFRDGQDRGMP
jgi:anti-anti-sigma factor